MIALIQRVLESRVVVDGEVIGAIDSGMLALIAVQKEDGDSHLERMVQRLLNYRIFPDAAGRMNLSLRDTGKGLLLVPQFTLAADTRKGNRPSFSGGASPEMATQWFDRLCKRATANHENVEFGRFGADMQVHLVNDGPVTFWLQG